MRVEVAGNEIAEEGGEIELRGNDAVWSVGFEKSAGLEGVEILDPGEEGMADFQIEVVSGVGHVHGAVTATNQVFVVNVHDLRHILRM